MLSLPLFRRLVFWTLAFLVTALALRVEPVLAQTPGEIAGVMTRWQMSSKKACQQTYNNYANLPDCPRSLMFTITPYLAGLTLSNWVSTLSAAGVNTGVIYVIPGYKLAADQTISDAEWQAYNQYIYLAPDALTDAQKQVILQVGIAISQRQYTVAQRNDAIIAFLAQLQKVYPHSTPVKFILDERVWFISHLNRKGKPILLSPADVFTREQAYSDDIAGILQMAESQNLGGWLSGVRLSEYAAKDWNLMGPVMVDLAALINAKASGWMKAHVFIGAGGGWGQYWNGINAMQCPANEGWQFPSCRGTFPFFALMSQQAGYFAFGDKFMDFGKPQQYQLNGSDSGVMYTYINGEAAAFCQQNTRKYTCQTPDAPTVNDWQAFLSDDVDGQGFSDLIAFLSANAAKYPKLANVIFEGDNSDSFATMTLPSNLNGASAISNLFSDAMQGRYHDAETGAVTGGLHLGTWTGKIFLNGIDDPSTVPRPGFYADTGLSMFQTNYNGFMFTPKNVEIYQRESTTANWVHWPHLTPQPAPVSDH